jgi:hypothetical protein
MIPTKDNPALGNMSAHKNKFYELISCYEKQAK